MGAANESLKVHQASNADLAMRLCFAIKTSIVHEWLFNQRADSLSQDVGPGVIRLLHSHCG